MDWQSIETAPKDGTKFLAFETGGYPAHYECMWCDDDVNGGYWMDEADSGPTPTDDAGVRRVRLCPSCRLTPPH